MKIGIIAPSKIENLLKVNKNAELIIGSVAKTLKNYEIYLTPDKGSVSELFAKKYLEYGGKKLYSVIPLQDKEFGFGWVNLDIGKNVNCNVWRNQPENLNERTDALVCLGFSAGGLAEIAYSKWFNKKPVYIVEDLISSKLPKELENSLDLRYVGYDNLRIENASR
jgi:hypothetical protein